MCFPVVVIFDEYIVSFWSSQILDEWFGRTVIRSCIKMSYNHAQGFIDNPDRDWTPDELPPISDGFTIPQIRQKVQDLNKVYTVPN